MILGAWSGHDASYAIVGDDGSLKSHCELERHIREKEVAADSIAWFLCHHKTMSEVAAIATCHSAALVKQHRATHGIPVHVIGHHEAHAADARYSSHFDECAILIVDGGGYEDAAGATVATSLWRSRSPALLEPVMKIQESDLNIGGLWTRATRYIFGLESGWPYGHQAGSVMAMAALGDPSRFAARFRAAMTVDRAAANKAPLGHVRGMSAKDPKRPKHPYFADLETLALSDRQTMFDLAASLQAVTEEKLEQLVTSALSVSDNVCLSGGVALNSVAAGKLLTRFGEEKLHIPPVPYDGGLCIGAARHYAHVIMKRSWTPSADWSVPYLGSACSAGEISAAVASAGLRTTQATDRDAIDALDSGEILAVLCGRAESGRRALGHRSIIADPRRADMKERVNERVKHRQSYRPFAPSVLREHVVDWFQRDASSPYMSFVLQLKPEKIALVPAIAHLDGSARVQTLTKADNDWYYDFVKLWHERSRVPMLLNTSFNDREPICETAEHAVRCFAQTDIDALYFPELGLMARR